MLEAWDRQIWLENGSLRGADEGPEAIQKQISIVAADVTQQGLIIHFSDLTTCLFAPSFLYQARESADNTPLLEQGRIVANSPFASALEQE